MCRQLGRTDSSEWQTPPRYLPQRNGRQSERRTLLFCTPWTEMSQTRKRSSSLSNARVASAGAVVLGTIFENGLRLRDAPGSAITDGFNFLRNVAIAVHVRAPAPAGFLSARPDLLRIAADEPTAWVVRGDSAEIVG